MKIISTSKKIITTVMLGLYTIISIPNAHADEANASDPIASIANTNTTNDNNDNTTQVTSGNGSSKASRNSVSQNSQNDDVATPLSKKSQDAIANMLLQSVSLMGIAYKWGGNTPTTGMDCSGFVRYVYQKSLGINLPRTAAEQARVGKRISIDNLEPGDLIFFNSRRGSNTHVGIYLGNNKFIQSPRTGENIQISDLSGNWRKNFNGAKRIVQENPDSNGDTNLQNFQDVRDEALPVSKRVSTGKKGRHGRSHVVSAKKATNKSSAKKSSKSTTTAKSKKKKHN